MTKRKGLPTTAPESHLTHIIAQKGGIQDMVEQALDIELAGPLAKGQINVFVAESGKGKSLLAFIVAWKELQNRNFDYVFYLDLDNPHGIWKDRYSNFEKNSNLIYLTEYILNTKDLGLIGDTAVEKAMYFLETSAKEMSNTLVVLDSLQNFADYNDLRNLKSFFKTLKTITNAGGTVLVLHHKSSKIGSEKFKGLSYIKDASDVVWEVFPDHKKTGEISGYKLNCIKSRSTTNFVNFVVTFSTDTGTVSYNQNVLFQEEIPIKEAILKVLQQKPNQKQADIVQAAKDIVNVNEKKIRSVLTKMTALGILTMKSGSRHTKLYSINVANIEPGYLDGLGEGEED